MQGGLSRADKKLLWWFGAAALLFTIGMIAVVPPEREEASPVPSSYSADSGGALAAYLLLVNLHFPVARWEDQPSLLPSSESSLLILAEPTEKPTERERAALLGYVQKGGRILFCGDGIASFFNESSVTKAERAQLSEFAPAIPSRYSRSAGKILIQPKAYWGALNGSQFRLYGDDQSPVVLSWKIGNGEILWWAAATPLTNAAIRRSDNLNFLLSTVAGASSIYWDEYFHGRRGSLWSYVAATPLPWGLVQLGVLAVVIIFTFSRRSGPTFIPAGRSRLSPLEFVDTMGGLYQRAGAATVAVEVSYKRLRLQLARRLALPASASDAELGEAAGERLGFSRDQIIDTLQRASQAAKSSKLSSSEALRIVQRILALLPHH